MTTDSKARASAKRGSLDMFLSIVDNTPVFGPPPRASLRRSKKKRVKRVWAKLRALQKFKMLVAPESKMNGSKEDAHKTRGSHASAISDASAADEWPNDSMTSAHSEYPEL